MATAVDTYNFADDGVALKAYLGITGGAEDTNLTLWIDAAAQDCDEHLKGEDFIDDDDVDISHPAGIRLGIYEWVRAYRLWFKSNRQAGLTQKTTGPLRETYRADVVGLIEARAASSHLWLGKSRDASLWGSVAN